MKPKFLFLIFLIILFSSSAYAIVEFEVGKIKVYDPIYEDERAKILFEIVNNEPHCDIYCSWETIDNKSEPEHKISYGHRLTNIPEYIDGKHHFNGYFKGQLKITCREPAAGFWCVANETTQTFSFEFTTQYNGDNICTQNPLKESCATAPKDCACASDERCEGSGLSAQCKTYCGNDICESNESPETCPADCGKPDGLTCARDDECANGFCVHNVCASFPYIENDGFCDLEEGENCKNSVSDCACGPNERCDIQGICSTYCGNGVCEESERGICKQDCEWCGDAVCSEKESCSTCPQDCGSCKQNKAVEATKKTNITLIVIGGLILLSGVGGTIFYYLKQKKR